MTKEVLKRTEERMKGVIEATKKEFSAIRTGRANPALLDRITVECYGSNLPINQVATISAPEPRLLIIQPWDKTVLGQIEKALLKSNLGLTPTSDGSVIRLTLPQLTEERRRELVRIAKKQAEDMRVTVRNLRREANEQLKAMEKDGQISEDELKRSQDEVQKLTDRYISEIDALLSAKEKEIMEV
ncbi:MAG TPA: ribosome recycling factor [Firmicutes bacterium]|nr:ribosome recycling factor [Bacillota bacterium]